MCVCSYIEALPSISEQWNYGIFLFTLDLLLYLSFGGGVTRGTRSSRFRLASYILVDRQPKFAFSLSLVLPSSTELVCVLVHLGYSSLKIFGIDFKTSSHDAKFRSFRARKRKTEIFFCFPSSSSFSGGGDAT